jgi:hypothetical protein
MANYSSIFYKADQRSSETAEAYKAFSALSQGHIQLPMPNAFGSLLHLDDVFLLPGKEITYSTDDDTHQVILPVAGGLQYNNALAKDAPVQAEEVLFLREPNELFRIRNPYGDRNTNYLHLRLKKNKPGFNSSVSYPVSFNEFNKPASLNLDKLEEQYYACAGIYKGRTKNKYILKNPQNGVFAYVINGAFELEERLMEYRDGLALWNLKEVEFEALSEFAILLLLEIPLDNDFINN